MNRFLLLIPLIFMFSFENKLDAYKEEIKKFQDELNREFKDKEESPLTPKDRRKFKGLDFYDIDSKYCIKTKFVRTPNEKEFKMKTTTSRLPTYVKYGEVSFTLDSKNVKLNIYQNPKLVLKEEYKNHLFLPYKDLTNGVSSYDGGRYVDLRIPKGDSIIIDFNKSYNPYCAYNHNYSCPIPPSGNSIDLEIKAGVKKFGSKH